MRTSRREDQFVPIRQISLHPIVSIGDETSCRAMWILLVTFAEAGFRIRSRSIEWLIERMQGCLKSLCGRLKLFEMLGPLRDGFERHTRGVFTSRFRF